MSREERRWGLQQCDIHAHKRTYTTVQLAHGLVFFLGGGSFFFPSICSGQAFHCRLYHLLSKVPFAPRDFSPTIDPTRPVIPFAPPFPQPATTAAAADAQQRADGPAVPGPAALHLVPQGTVAEGKGATERGGEQEQDLKQVSTAQAGAEVYKKEEGTTGEITAAAASDSSSQPMETTTSPKPDGTHTALPQTQAGAGVL